MDWTRDGTDWPHRAASRFVESRPHRWHVQIMGDGPDLLLLHGTGGASHGWADVLPLLARDFRVIAPDLPGHGFSRPGTRHRSRPGTMAEDLWRLMDRLDARPRWLVGHSAGAAIALHMASAKEHEVEGVVGVNAALDGFRGPAGWAFPMAARAMAATPGIGFALSRLTRDPQRIAQLLEGTGSHLPDSSIAVYAQLFADPGHLRGTLEMMAQWSTRGLPSLLKTWDGALVLLAGELDRTVPPETSRRAAACAPRGRFVSLGPLGHLAAEEAPETVAREIADAIRRHTATPTARLCDSH